MKVERYPGPMDGRDIRPSECNAKIETQSKITQVLSIRHEERFYVPLLHVAPVLALSILVYLAGPFPI